MNFCSRYLVLIAFAFLSLGAQAQTTAALVAGWNLIGNGSTATLNVASTALFGDSGKVTTVWKWVPASSRWAFYTPNQTDGGAAYAASKGYDFLTTISGGEGFWVNAKTAFTASLPAGTAVTSASFQSMASGWSLIAIGDNKTPRTFNNALSLTPPAAGDIPPNVTTLWAWDAVQANWYFYAPSLDANGTLSGYITGKSFLDFGSKVLDPAMGFWANKPTTTPATTPTTTPTTTSTTTTTTRTTTSTTTTTTVPIVTITPTPSSGSADYSTSISITESSEGNFTLTAAEPRHLSTSDYILLPTATTIWTFTAAEYAVSIYMLDHDNAQLFLNNSAFQGYLIGAPGGATGLGYMTLPAGQYWIGTVPGQSSLGSNYSNRVYHEVAYYSLPNWVEDINVPLGTGMVNPRGWVSKGFTIGSGDYRGYLETEGMGGTFAVMTAAQYASFQAANSNGLSNGGSYSYIYACGNQSGGAATEIECELKLPAGTYYLVYLNDQQTAMGGAANIQFYLPN